MTYYAYVLDVPAPAGVYDATHTELLRRTGGHIDGLIMHVCRATEGGFQILEVWTDRAASERADRDVVAPVLAEHVGTGSGPPPDQPQLAEFAVRGLVIPAAGIAT